MKVRLSNQSLRIRISSEEAEQLIKGEEIISSLKLNVIDSFEVILKSWKLSIGEISLEAKKLIASIPESATTSLLKERGYSFQQQQETDIENPLIWVVEVDLEKVK